MIRTNIKQIFNDRKQNQQVKQYSSNHQAINQLTHNKIIAYRWERNGNWPAFEKKLEEEAREKSLTRSRQRGGRERERARDSEGVRRRGLYKWGLRADSNLGFFLGRKIRWSNGYKLG